MEQKSKKWKKEELKVKTDKLRSISKQSGKSVESVLKKKRKATVLSQKRALMTVRNVVEH